ncbi:MAG: PAS domain S-box protein [Myxococcales bacterium]|nr:PAS domain S-box protein [Myxococcales bacterium]
MPPDAVSEHHWQSLFEGIPDTMMVVDADGHILEINHVLAPLTREQAIGSDIRDYVPPQSVPRVEAALRAAFEERKGSEYEIEYTGPGETSGWFRVQVAPVIHDDEVQLATFIARDVTSQRSLEIRTRKFAAIVERTPEAVVMADSRGLIDEWNAAAAELFGYRADEILGQPFSVLLPPERKHEVGKVREAIATGGSPPEVTERMRKDGSRVHVMLSVAPVVSDSGALLGSAALIRDVSSLQQEAQQLREGNRALALGRAQAEHTLSTLLESLPDGVVVSRNSVLLYVNEAFASIVGYPSVELLGMQAADFIRPEQHRTVIERLRDVERHGAPPMRDYELLTKSGSSVPVEAISRTVVFQDEPAVLTVVRDVRERREVEQARRRSEALYARLMGAVTDAIIAVNLELRIRAFNEGAESIFGHHPASVLGGDLSRMIPGSAEFFTSLAELATGKREAISAMRIEAERLGGERFAAEVSATRVDAGDDPSIILILRDVSERERIERRLQEAEKLEAVGRLASGVAHEINNALFVISANLEQAVDVLDDDHIASEPLSGALEGTARSARVVRALLDYSRSEVNIEQGEHCAAHALLRGSLEAYRRLAGQGIEIFTRLEARDDAVPLPDARFEQIVHNVVLNACAALGGGGRLSLTTRNRIEGNGGSDGSLHFELEIADDGPGMDEAVRTRVFEPFFTTKAPGEGTGLGMAVVSSIVSRSGGRAEVHSKPGAGTRFVFSWPTAQASASAEAETSTPPGAATDAASASAERTPPVVLVVDDDATIRRLVVRLVRSGGFEVVEASDGESAIQALGSERRIDLLLTDHMMPGLKGSELVERARALRPQLPAILLSGMGQKLTQPEPWLRMLAKPVRREKLHGAIAELLMP